MDRHNPDKRSDLSPREPAEIPALREYRIETTRQLDGAPRYAEIQGAILEGKRQYLALKRELGLSPEIEKSSVHHDWELDLQSRVVLQGSTTLEQAICMARMMPASHDFDDEFDKPSKGSNRELFHENRFNMESFLSKWGAWGDLTERLCADTPNPELARRGFQRVAFGALLIHSGGLQREELLTEYKTLSFIGLDDRVGKLVTDFERIPYALTTNSTQELFFAAQPNADRNLAELCTIALAPVGYCHDHENEKKAGESLGHISVAELASMLQKVLPLFSEYETFPSHRIRQFKTATIVYSHHLPSQVHEAYRELIGELERILPLPQ